MSFEQIVIICLLVIDCLFVSGLSALCAVIIHMVRRQLDNDGIMERAVTVLETLAGHYNDQSKAVSYLAYWVDWLSVGGDKTEQ